MVVRGLRTAIGAAALIPLFVSAVAAQRTAVEKAPGRVIVVDAGPSTQRAGAIRVKAVDAKGAPLAGAELRLRDLATGRTTAADSTSVAGECGFAQLAPGAYIAELIGRDGGVEAVSDVTTIASGEVAQVIVRLQDRSRSFAWWLGATTTAALAQAASLGVFAVDPGQPVSPQR